MIRSSVFEPARRFSVGNALLIAAALCSWSGVGTAAGFLQAPGSNHVQQKPVSGSDAKFVADEVLVRFKPGVAAHVRQHTASNLGGRFSLPIGSNSNLARVKLGEGSDVATVVQAYRADPNVEHAQPNYIYRATAVPNDPGYDQLWGMSNTGQVVLNPSYSTNNPGTAGYDIDAELAWDEITDCRTVVVAVLDTGINYSHEDLAANMWDGSGMGFPNHGFDFVDNDNNPMPTGGGEDHGSHVAGTIGAVGNNALGVTGVCWQASIMSVRVLGATGSGTTADIVAGTEFASDNGASVINMSLSGEYPFDLFYSDAIDYARDRDVIVVVAAGNDAADNDGGGADGAPSTKLQPCTFSQDNLICVAALDQAYDLASFSSYGAASVDVGGPGTNTLSSIAGAEITDDFSVGWTLNGGWARISCPPFDVLANPANYCSTGGYANDLDARAYKTFDLSGTTAVELEYYAQVDTESEFDFFSTAIRSSGGDPFAGGNTVDSVSGTTFNLLFPFDYDISTCNSATCSVGFRLTSDSTRTFRGVAIVAFSIRTLQPNSSSYTPFNGTSMATPHVAGIAAMVRAYNPSFTYAQTIEAIKNSGELVPGLAGITTTGRAVNARSAITYIAEPTGLSAVVQ